MTPDALFQITNPLVLLGWLALALTPLAPVWTMRIGFGIAVAHSVLYTALVAVYFAGAEGGYDSLANVMLLFDDPGVALAGWVHYLAFDLFIGAWEVRVARREGIAHALVLPCLVLTFLFGPVGLVLFLAIRAAYAMRAQPA